MMYVIYTTRGEAIMLQALALTLSDYPSRGVHIGGGRHVDLDAPGRPGWTTQLVGIREHPDGGQWAIPITDLEALFVARGDTRLNVVERATVTTAIAAKKTLDATWNKVPP